METPLFNKAWQSAKLRIFRLEALPEYDAPQEKAIFDKWKKGNKTFTDYDGWFKMIGQAARNGLAVQRVRVFRLPLSEYAKYELDLLKASRKHGEQALAIEERKYASLIQNLDFKPKDFWLFDDKLVIIFDYNEKGGLIGEKLVTDKDHIGKYLELRNRLTENSLSLTPFLYNIKRSSIVNQYG